MEKKIIVTMLPSKAIQIAMSGGSAATITLRKDNREIMADEIYKFLDFTIGDHYSVESVNDNHLDEQVVQFFSQLLSEITQTLNQISKPTDDSPRIVK